MKTNPLVAFLCLCAISIPFGLIAAPHAVHDKGVDADGNTVLRLDQLSATTSEAYNHVVDPAEHHGPGDFQDSWRRGVVTGYHLGFRSLADENRELRRPSDIPVTEGFFKSFYMDFHYANQEFNSHFFKGEDTDMDGIADTESIASGHPVELDVYGITLGFRLGDNPNMDVRIPLSAAQFDVEGVDDTGFVGGIEIFPHYRINEYIAWGVRFAHNTSISDFPIFDESMTNVNFETMAESSTAYGMNWSGRLSIGRYFPSNDINDDAFWLIRPALALHYHMHDNFTFLPFFRYNYATEGGTNAAGARSVLDQTWTEFGAEFLFMPNAPWNFSFGIAGIGHHKIIEESMEFYFNMKGNF
ncbi:MAG: hypothetical protein VX130_01330 [Verrucomicrobiota bacterium]|nr:hypothetical protein [Verrucomicrobiota bacterium]